MSVILVTGAAGFIGSHVTDKLLERGEQVVGLDNFDPYYPRLMKEENLCRAAANPRFRLIEADLRDSGAIAAAFAQVKPDYVVHLGAKAGVRPSIQDPTAYVQSNVIGTINLLRGCEQRPPRHFIFASSSSVYGETAKVPFSESDRTDTPASPYAATKKAGEALCYTYHHLLSMPVTCLRFFTVIGPRQRPDLALHKFVRLIASGRPIPFYGDGSTSRDYTYVEDIAAGILAALDNPSGYEIYNLGNSHPITLCAMVETIERALGKPALLDRQPDQPGDVRATYADIGKAQAQLGYQPKTEFAEGVRRFTAWWERAAAK